MPRSQETHGEATIAIHTCHEGDEKAGEEVRRDVISSCNFKVEPTGLVDRLCVRCKGMRGIQDN